MKTSTPEAQETGPKSDKKSPGFWFYTADYERDMQILSLASQGLWARMLCWMSENEAHRGFTELPSGQPFGVADIAAKVGKSVREIEKCLTEMARIGTYSLDERNCFYCRKMARDTHISTVRKAAAKSRMETASRAANGSFAGGFDPPNGSAKEKQNPTVTASVSVSVSDSIQEPLCPTEVGLPGGHPKKVYYDENFLVWYKTAYWNHNAKVAGRKAYEKAISLLVDRDHMGYDQARRFITEQTVEYKQRFGGTESWSWRQNLLPATWLHQELWTDEVNISQENEHPKQSGMNMNRHDLYES